MSSINYLAGHRVGPYQLVAWIGGGRSGAVYRALDQQRRWLAVKVLAPALAADAELRRQLRAELELAQQLRHPGLVEVIGLEIQDGLVLVLTELVEGTGLREQLSGEQAVDPARTLALLAPLAGALDYTHGRGLVHGDLKPSSVIVHPRRGAVLVDPGVARATEGTSLALGRLGDAARYLAPEALRLGRTSSASDRYGLAALALELLLGPAVDATRWVAVPPAADGVLPLAAQQALRRQLGADPAARYATSSDFLAALAGGLGIVVPAVPGQARPSQTTAPERLMLSLAQTRHVLSLFRQSTAHFPRLPVGSRGAWRRQAGGLLLLACGVALLARPFVPGEPPPSPTALASLVTLQPATGVPSIATAGGARLTGGTMAPVPTTVQGRPLGARAIDAGSASELRELARWGRGVAAAVAVAPDGTTLAVASSEGVYLQESGAAKPSRFLPTGAYTRVVAFAPDGRALAAGSDDGVVRLWSLTVDEPPGLLRGHTGPIQALTFTPDGATLASGGGDQTIRIWRRSDGAARGTLSGHTDAVVGLAFSPDGRLLVSGSLDDTVRVWRGPDWTVTRTIRVGAGAVEAVALAPNGSTLAIGGADRTIRFWPIDADEPSMVLRAHTAAVRSVVFSPDGTMLASGAEDGLARLWQVSDGAPWRTLAGHGAAVQSVAITSTGQELATASLDGSIRLWALPSGSLSRTLDGYSSPLLAAAAAPGGGQLAFGTRTGTIGLWRPDEPAGLVSLVRGHTGPVTSLVFSADDQWLLSGADDGSARLWAANAGIPLGVFAGSVAAVHGVALSTDRQIVATVASDGVVRTWRASDGVAQATLEGPTEGLVSLALAPDGRTVAAGGADGAVWLWQLPGGAPLGRLPQPGGPVTSVAFAPDGQSLAASAGDGLIRRWRLPAGAPLGDLVGHAGPVWQVAFAPHGEVLASAGADRTVRLWRLADGTPLTSLTGHSGPVRAVGFGGSGRLLASASEDGTIRVWGVP